MQLLRRALPAYLHGSLRSHSSEEKNHAGASLLDERLNCFFTCPGNFTASSAELRLLFIYTNQARTKQTPMHSGEAIAAQRSIATHELGALYMQSPYQSSLHVHFSALLRKFDVSKSQPKSR